MDISKFANDADAVLSQLGKFASLISALIKAWEVIAAGNGGDMAKASVTLEKHLAPGAPNAPALSPDAKP